MATSYVPPDLIPAKAYAKLPPRIRIEAAIETLIGILDAADPDTDFELTGAEDDFCEHDDDGAGCPVSDTGGGNVEDQGEDENDAEIERGVTLTIIRQSYLSGGANDRDHHSPSHGCATQGAPTLEQSSEGGQGRALALPAQPHLQPLAA